MVPSGRDLAIFGDQERRTYQFLFLAAGGKSQMIALVRHSAFPANCHVIILGDNVLNMDVNIGEGSAEVSVNSLESFGADDKPVRVGKAVAFELGMKQPVDGCLTLLVPDLLKPFFSQFLIRI